VFSLAHSFQPPEKQKINSIKFLAESSHKVKSSFSKYRKGGF